MREEDKAIVVQAFEDYDYQFFVKPALRVLPLHYRRAIRYDHGKNPWTLIHQKRQIAQQSPLEQIQKTHLNLFESARRQSELYHALCEDFEDTTQAYGETMSVETYVLAANERFLRNFFGTQDELVDYFCYRDFSRLLTVGMLKGKLEITADLTKAYDLISASHRIFYSSIFCEASRN